MQTKKAASFETTHEEKGKGSEVLTLLRFFEDTGVERSLSV